MEIVEGKPTDNKVIVAQEIAFARVLAGNDKTLRDRAIKKLRKWLRARGTGEWVFTEEEFIRIWTGLFYCMWMSDKFLIQEELAENISHLIHCFKNNSDSALLFFKSFNKRLLMEYQGLDQYRIDKFNMLIRRFFRQTLVYCKAMNWNESFLKNVMNVISTTVFHKDSALGFVLHFINIYLEEVAKVSKGKLDNKTVLLLIEPFVKLLATSKEKRLQTAAVDFFNDLMRQTDAGIEFEEKLNVWKKLGFPGRSVNCIQKQPVNEFSRKQQSEEKNSDDEIDDDDDDDDDDNFDEPLDPRAGSVNVELPQIPVDIPGLINVFKKHEFGKQTTANNRKKIRDLIQKFSVLNKGRFPVKIKKDPVIDEKIKKGQLTIKTAKNLMKYTEEIDSGPIKTKEFLHISRQLNAEINKKNKNQKEKEIDAEDNSDVDLTNGIDEDSNDADCKSDDVDEKADEIIEKLSKSKKKLKKSKGAKKQVQKNKIKENKVAKIQKKLKTKKKIEKNNSGNAAEKIQKSSKKDTKKCKKKLLNGVKETLKNNEKIIQVPKIRKSLNCEASLADKKQLNGGFEEETVERNELLISTPKKKNGVKRKILSDWMVQDVDEASPEYNRIKPQKVIKLEVKFDRSSDSEENQEPDKLKNSFENPEPDNEINKQEKKVFTPVFWEKAKAKVLKKKKANNIFVNPFAEGDNDSSFRRISFALEKNMAQENEEYLEEVRNSPKVPFDGSKKPVQSALKSGLSPSPINPFYRRKKIKF